MKLHPRHNLVARAEAAARITFADAVKDLTYAEIFSMLGGMIQDYAKYAKRSERHPESPDTPVDVE